MIKPKKCRVCGYNFVRRSSTQTVCDLECAKILAIAVRKKAEEKLAAVERKADKVKREKLKTRAQWIKEAQIAFNAWIRERDKQAGHPCISSGKPLDWTGNQTDAGHFRSIGSAPHLRFCENNCHAQSKHDNRFLSGNAVAYRKGLIERIGIEAVEALEADQTARKYSVEALVAIKGEYAAKARKLKGAQ